MTVFKHLKTGKYYILECIAIDATNSRDGEKVAVYRDTYGNTFVRNQKEFDEKFKPLPISQWPNHNNEATLHQIILDGISRDFQNYQIRFETNYLASDDMINYYRKAFNDGIVKEQFERDCG